MGSLESAIDLHQLPDLPSLAHLLLDGRVAAAQLTTLRRFASLRKLSLRLVPELRDADLASLHGLTQLTSLRIANCEQLADASLAALRAALPGCRISSDIW